jgi:5-deoxy-D-glucuronate isomerase
MSTATLDKSQIVFRRTNAHVGRQLSVTPANSAMKELSYGRIVLDASQPSVTVETVGDEVALICLGGQATVTVAGTTYPFGRFDSLYVPREHTIEIRTDSSVDIAECRAPITGTYPLRYINYAKDELGAQLQDRIRERAAPPEHPDRQERGSRAPDGGRHVVGARPLDQLAAARARGHRRGVVRLLRHAA